MYLLHCRFFYSCVFWNTFLFNRYIRKYIRSGLASCPTLGLSASCLSLSLSLLLALETNASVWLLSITHRPLHHPSRITSTSCTHPGGERPASQQQRLSGIWYPSNPYPNLPTAPPSVGNFSFSQQKARALAPPNKCPRPMSDQTSPPFHPLLPLFARRLVQFSLKSE